MKTDGVEELIQQIFMLCDLARLGRQIIRMPSCNECRRKGCEYKPHPGEWVRYNCPHWEGGDHGDD